MDITRKEIRIKPHTIRYRDDSENGVVGYGSRLDIRHPYPRGFIYGERQRDAVTDWVTKDIPLNKEIG